MDVIYFEFSVSLIEADNVVFTDASANTAEPPNFYHDSSDLDQLNWDEIDSLKWSSASDELRHQRMAEVLVHRELPLKAASRVVVWNETVRTRVDQMVKRAGVVFPAVGFESRDHRHWFKKFMYGEPRQSLVTGPRGIACMYQIGCQEIAAREAKNKGAPFETLQTLLEALSEDFGCLPQTAELVGLESANRIHHRTVDAHTLDVVAKLKSLPEYASLPSDADRDMVELAAYLHDIGKGPKDRWAKHDGVQQVDPDHPVGAVPMMVDILTNQVRSVTQGDAELLLKLVCYHDLAGDVLGNGRDERQIVEVARDRRELDLLFALGKADAISLVEWWWDGQAAKQLYNRCRTAIETRT
jgi:hypothetical protein